MALHSLYCADVPLRNCSLTHLSQNPAVCDVAVGLATLLVITVLWQLNKGGKYFCKQIQCNQFCTQKVTENGHVETKN